MPFLVILIQVAVRSAGAQLGKFQLVAAQVRLSQSGTKAVETLIAIKSRKEPLSPDHGPRISVFRRRTLCPQAWKLCVWVMPLILIDIGSIREQAAATGAGVTHSLSVPGHLGQAQGGPKRCVLGQPVAVPTVLKWVPLAAVQAMVLATYGTGGVKMSLLLRLLLLLPHQ